MRLLLGTALGLCLFNVSAWAQGSKPTDDTATSTPSPSPAPSASPAPSPTDALIQAANQRKAAEEAIKEAIDAEKNRIVSEQQLAVARVGTVPGQTAITGAVSGETAKAEGLLLVTRSATLAAKPIAAKLAPILDIHSGKRVLVITSRNDLNASEAVVFDLQVHGLAEAFKTLLDAGVELDRDDAALVQKLKDEAKAKPQAGRGARSNPPPRSLAAVLPVAGALIDNFAKLGSYFQTDYKFGEITVDQSPELLAAAVVDSLPNVNFAFPTLSLTIDPTPILTALKPLDADYGRATSVIAFTISRAAELKAKQGADARELAIARRYDALAAALTKTVTAYEALVTGLASGATASEPALVVRIARQKQVQAALKDSTPPLVLLVTGKQVAAYYTKKNLWTFFGGPPLYAMGGTSMTYFLFDARTGNLLTAGSAASHGGYGSVRDIEKLFK